MFARLRVIALACLVLGLWTPACPAQVVEDEEISNEEAVLGEYGKSLKDLKSAMGGIRGIAGNVAPTVPEEKMLKAAAQYLVLRVTWQDVSGKQDELEKVVKEFSDFYIGLNKFDFGYGTRLATRGNNLNPHFAKVFHEELAKCFKAVFDRKPFMKNRLTSVNAAQMLALAGKGKTEEMSDLLVELINSRDKDREVIKLFALRALKDYFPLNNNPDARDMTRIKALTDFIERPNAAKLQPAAFCFIRREAIQSLAHIQVPAVKVKGQPDARPAITFMKVLAKKKYLDPAPDLLEKCHAAWGLCDLKPDGDYQPDLAAVAVGHALVDFLEAYRADAINIPKPGKEGPLAKDGRRLVPRHHWKIMAEHWKDGLKIMSANSPQANNLKGTADKLLNTVVAYGTVEANDINVLTKMLGPPQGNIKLFKVSKIDLDMGN